VWEEPHALFVYEPVEPPHHPVKVTWPRDPRSDTNSPEEPLTNLLPRLVRVILEVEEEAVSVAVVGVEEEIEVEVEVVEAEEEILHLPRHHQPRVLVLHAGDDDDDEVVS